MAIFYDQLSPLIQVFHQLGTFNDRCNAISKFKLFT